MSWPYHSGNIAFLFTLYRMFRAVGGCNVILQDSWFSWKHLNNYWPKIVFEDICILLRVYIAIDRYKCSNTIKCYTWHSQQDRQLFIILYSKTRFKPFLIVFFPDMNITVFPNTNLNFIRKNHLFPISIYRTMKFWTTPSPPLETVSITDE